MGSLGTHLPLAGLTYVAATLGLRVSEAALGTPPFFAFAAVAILAYVVALARVWNATAVPRGLFLSAMAFAVLIRAPLAVAPVNPENDMVRYVWDGRIQRLGINPYLVLPADPEVQWTHTEETRHMPSARHRTPYPPAAQLFFRMVVTLHDSSRAMKLALVACDLLTMLVLWRWLAAAGLNQWLTLTYAWNPLVVLEVSHSGHIDALGALWTVAAACWLSRRRSGLASIAYVLAVATKLLPIVLLPLFWRRVTRRDAVLGATFMALLYIPFMAGPQVALGGVNRVVEHIRFNGPIFLGIMTVSHFAVAAAVAVVLGLGVAVWCRTRLSTDHPASWAWPMAVALACGPVIYPWYLLYFTPFLFAFSTVPLIVWTFSVLPVYLAWAIPEYRDAWTPPPAVLLLEYGTLLAACAVVFWRCRSAPHSSGITAHKTM